MGCIFRGMQSMDEPYHINVFCDCTEKLHYSSEEFSINDSNITSFSGVLEDACKLAVLGQWHYLCTLKTDAAMSHLVRVNLNVLAHACDTLKASGIVITHLKTDEILGAVQHLEE